MLYQQQVNKLDYFNNILSQLLNLNSERDFLSILRLNLWLQYLKKPIPG
jgi:hypothetical protein